MGSNMVTFNIRYEKSQFQLKMESPSDVFQFIEKLKTELKIDDTNEIIILCPTSEGKMMEIKSNDDIAFLKKTKLSFNSESNEIYCSAELVLSVIHKQLLDDPKIQMMVLSDKIDQLTTQFEKVTQSLERKIDGNANALLNDMKLILTEHSKSDSSNPLETNSLGEQDNSFGPKQKIKNKTEKLSSTITTDDNLSKSYENINLEKNPMAANKKPKDTDSLLEMLVADGFTNTIQNIIVLKRFNNDYEKVIEYLKNCT